MGRHTLQRHQARQWGMRPLPARTKVHLGRRWAAGVAGGVGVLSVAFWGSDPAVVPALPLAGDVSTGSTEHPELLPSVGTGLRVATGLDQILNAGVVPAPELLKMALAKPLPSVTIDVHSVPESIPALPGYGSPAPVVRPPCPDPVQHPGAYREWWLKWFPHTTPPVVTPPVVTPPPSSTPAPEPAPVEEPDPLPAPSSPAQPPPAVEETTAPEPVHESEPTSAPEPESSSADDSGPAETASTGSDEESAPETKSSSDDSSSSSEKSSDSDSSSSEDSSDSSDHDSDSGSSSGSDSDKDSS